MRWVVVDGIDGSGKSTLASLVREKYEAEGERVLVRVHPSSSWIGRWARRALEGEGRAMRLLATFFFIIDVLGSLRALRHDSQEYETVVFVRYLMATAYLPASLAPMGYDFFARLLPIPSRLILVDVSPGTAYQRITERRHSKEMFEDVESLGRVRSKILMLAMRGHWRIVNNDGAREGARKQLFQALEEWDSSSQEGRSG